MGEDWRRQPGRRWTQAVLEGALVALVVALAMGVPKAAVSGQLLVALVKESVGLDGPGYSFLRLSDRGKPVGWDHCHPVYYMVNPKLAPENWETLVDDAARMTRGASGFDLQYGGVTDERDLNQSKDHRGYVLIGWATPEEAPVLSGTTSGSAAVAVVENGDRLEFVAGTILLDAGAYSEMTEAGRTEDQASVLAHELGHVLGLDHVDDIRELMYPRYHGQDGFGSGDIDGFERLRDQPCASQP